MVDAATFAIIPFAVRATPPAGCVLLGRYQYSDEPVFVDAALSDMIHGVAWNPYELYRIAEQMVRVGVAQAQRMATMRAIMIVRPPGVSWAEAYDAYRTLLAAGAVDTED